MKPGILRLGVVLLAMLPAAALAQRAVSRKAPMAPEGTLEVSNIAGEVSIESWERDEIEVSGEIAERAELEFSADGEHARVEVGWDEGADDEEAEAELRIRVPATTRVRATTVAAGIRVEGLTGELRLQSVSGDIEAQRFGPDVTIGTISGTVWVDGDGQAGTLHLSVVSGEASVSGIAGDLTARTVSGDLDIRAGALRRTRVDTTSGSVDLRATLEPGARFEADSTSGDLRFELCGNTNARYELSSFSGEIRALDGRRGEAASRHGPSSELRFEVGDGSGLVRVNSLSGNIDLDEC
jgi:DUF4097 and DUF4098 domain-containing protein YvlB